MLPEINAKDKDVTLTPDKSKALNVGAALLATYDKSMVLGLTVGNQRLYLAAPGTTTSKFVKVLGASKPAEVLFRISGPAKGERSEKSGAVEMTEADLLKLAQ